MKIFIIAVTATFLGSLLLLLVLPNPPPGMDSAKFIAAIVFMCSLIMMPFAWINDDNPWI